MHACALAAELGLGRVLVPKVSGVLSALGLAISDLRRDYVSPLLRPLESVDEGDLEAGFAAMERSAATDLDSPQCTRRADLRYRSQSFELTVGAERTEELASRFHAAHEARYGYRMEDEPLELVNLRLIATVPVERPELAEGPPPDTQEPPTRRVSFRGEWRKTPVHDRESLGKGSRISGPAVVEFRESTCVVPPGWSGEVDGAGTLVLESEEGGAA